MATEMTTARTSTRPITLLPAAPDHFAAAGHRKGNAPLDAAQRLFVRGEPPWRPKTTCAARSKTLFNVKVLRVHTLNRKGKPRRTRFSSGYTKDWKKAIVKLHSEHRIDFF